MNGAEAPLERPRAKPPQQAPAPATARKPRRRKLGWRLFALMILTASYDKSGIVIGTTSVSIYKVLFLAVLALYLLGRVMSPARRPLVTNVRVHRWVVIFVVVETVASLLGNLFTDLPVSLASETYYLIQRSAFPMIPVLALYYDVQPRRLLKWFLAAILIHYAFIGLQFASPSAYGAIGRMLADQVRQDHTLGWNRESLDFIGLQRSSNYGAFAAAFGLLALGFEPRGRIGRMLRALIVPSALVIVVLSPSRATLIMAAVALIIWAHRRGWFSRASTYANGVLIGGAAAGLIVAGTLSPQRLGSVNAFLDPDPNRQGSNSGKLAIAELGLQLFRQSPVVGYGQRRFADLTLPLGNQDPFLSEPHSFALSTLLSSGLIGLAAYSVLWIVIVRALSRKRDNEYAIVCGLFIGLGFYNIVYDAGGLDLFACFNGLAAYYALMAVPQTVRTRPARPAPASAA